MKKLPTYIAIADIGKAFNRRKSKAKMIGHCLSREDTLDRLDKSFTVFVADFRKRLKQDMRDLPLAGRQILVMTLAEVLEVQIGEVR